MTGVGGPEATGKSPTKPISIARLDQMIEDAVVDANGESEEMTGFYTAIEENLAIPFPTEVLGIDVVVERMGRATETKERIRQMATSVRDGVNVVADILDRELGVP